MPLGLPVALALAAQAAPAVPPATPTADACRRSQYDPKTGEIVICAEKPQGYRIDPDILTVQKMKRGGGRPTRPGLQGTRDTSACVVGPHGCPSAGINLIAAALTAAEIAKRLAKGEEIGSLFITDPQPNEYQMYVMAKQAREAREAEKAAKAKTKAAAPTP